MGRGLRLLCAAALAAMAAPAVAQEVPQACVTPAADIDAPLVALGAEGWTPLPEGPLPPDVAGALVWLYVADYVIGDSGGETLPAIIALQGRTVTGLARKRDIPSSRTRFLTSDAGAMILMWREPVPGRIEVQCRIALTGPDAPGARPFVAAPTRAVEYGTLRTIALDRATLSDAVGRAVETAQLVETYLIHPAGAAQ